MTDYVKHNRRNLIFAGILIIGIGKMWLFHKLHWFALPEWLFTWKTLLIVLGLTVGLLTRFKELFWLVPVVVGAIFMLGDIPGVEVNLKEIAWPILFMVFGTFLLVRAFWKRSDGRRSYCGIESSTGEDYIDLTSIFGGSKRKIISKNFKGGETVNVFGGAELDFTQADINGTVVIDCTQVFGGVKIVVPANWNVRTELTSIMGGTDDKRNPVDVDENKTLVLTGVCIFGGIDIRSY